MSQKVIGFSFNGMKYEFQTQMRMVRQVGGLWRSLDIVSRELRNAALNAEKLKGMML